MTHTGWRKPTPGLLIAEMHAEDGEQLSIPKSKAVAAVKRVAASLGLRTGDIVVLDTLCAFTQAQDWEAGRRPIVWASNAYLEEKTGLVLRSLQRHVRRLCEAGIIAMKDSPNGKRYGRRDDDGYIVQAYGFDLAPLAARAEEFEMLNAQQIQEREACAALRSQITISRRVVRAKIEKARESQLRGPWRHLEAEFAELLQSLPGRSAALDTLNYVSDLFAAFKERIEEAFTAAFDWPEQSDAQTSSEEVVTSADVVPFTSNMSPKDDSDDMHLLTTNELHQVSSNCFEKKHAAGAAPKEPTDEPVEGAGDVDLDINWSTHTRKRKSDVDMPMIMIACPQFAEMARSMENGYLKDWNDFHRAAGKIRPMIGISEDAWGVANKVLSPPIAAAVVALIFDKQSEGQIQSPGGYLRALVERAQAGELHLDRTFFGRLSEARAV